MLVGPLSTAAETSAASMKAVTKSIKVPGCSSSSRCVVSPPAIFAEEIPLDISHKQTVVEEQQPSQHSSAILSYQQPDTILVQQNFGVSREGDHESERVGPVQNSNRPSSTLSTSGGDIYLTTRTTRMLLTVLILFLITEFPQGILALFSAIMGQEFFKHCYIPMANLMDFLALLNCSINFILYCFMSKRFRDTFCHLLLREY